MCGILVHDGTGNNFFVQKRGQDLTNTVVVNGIHFTHNLLSITGDTTIQPFIDTDIICLYNGEIYNYKYERSDGENLIPLYEEFGMNFPDRLDGEFAIVLFDFNKDLAFYITDSFATKPLWRNGIYASSYQSGVGGHKVEQSTIEVVKISTKDLVYKINYGNFAFDYQFKSNYDDCIGSFIRAVEKRAKHRCFIGLSSGYDSGAIDYALDELNVDYKAFAIQASEDMGILNQRLARNSQHQLIKDFDHNEMSEHLNSNAEEFFYNYYYNGKRMNQSYKNDWASKGLSYICKLGKKEGRKVYLSGMGADEILSDYSLIPAQSEFKGTFPNELYPWRNFYHGCMYSYLGKEECVAGSWNIETRYPFLDKEFVQEFLWLKPKLKNRKYKAPLYELLTRNKYPFKENSKIGFCI